MADPPVHTDPLEPDTGGSPTVGAPAAAPTTGMPRWVKVFTVIGVVLVLLAVVVLLAGGGPGQHGPGRHTGGHNQ